ncbi:MAG: SxtJ family membrane protein [Gemmatimonadota bacterium]
MSASEGRKFGLTVGLAFLALATVAWWRGRHTTVLVLGGLGGVLCLAGVLVPRSLGPIERAWMGLAHALSRVTTPIAMAVVYYVVLTPIGLLRRLVGRNPMVPPRVEASYWSRRPITKSDLSRQF